MTFDDIGNGAVGVVANNPGTGGLSLIFATGQGGNFEAVVNGFNALVIANPQTLPQKGQDNFEIIRITALSGDDATIERGQEGSSTINIQQGYYVFAGLTRKMIEDIISNFANYQPLAANLTSYAGKTPPSGSVVGTSDAQSLTNKTIDYNQNTIENLPTIGTDGWTPDGNTLVYVSGNSFKVSGKNVVAQYPKGTRIKFTNNSTTFYGVVISSSFSIDTTITLAPNSDYSINNSPITNPYYSYQLNPEGYPGWFNYSPSWSGFSANPSGVLRFAINGTVCFVEINAASNGTSNGAGLTFSLPVMCAQNLFVAAQPFVVDNGSAQTSPGRVDLTSGSVTATAYKTLTEGSWTNSGGKTIICDFFYEF